MAASTDAGSGVEPAIGGALDAAERARGRRLAIASHPASMTHRLAYTEQLPTLALVALGAGEAVVGLQRALEPLGQLLQLPTLRAVGRFRKGTILVAGQVIAVVGGLPLLAFGTLQALGEYAVALAMVAFAITSAGVVVSQTVWFPLLRSYVEHDRVGQFFGLLRSVWHLTLIGYYVAAQRWLAAYPGSFGPLFALAAGCGLLRILLVTNLPEPPSEKGERMRIREALRLLRTEASLRRYLLGVSVAGGARRVVVPFVIVLMRRVLGFSDSDVALATVAYYGGGFASLYVWGRVTDLLGAQPIFRATGGGLVVTYLALLAVDATNATVPLMVGLFFLLAVLNAGFGVADTHVLFRLAPLRAPTRLLVVADVSSSFVFGMAPLVVGLILQAALDRGADMLWAYRIAFACCAALTLVALIPLRSFRR